MSESQPLSLSAQAALSTAPRPQRSQFSHLVRHFLERFFNHETASPDGDAKTRLVQIACATGLPGFVVALYLWPIYHPLPGWPPGSKSHAAPPSYWLQVNHHLFFVLYSFVALGIATVFEWDLFFPDLLDIFVLKTSYERGCQEKNSPLLPCEGKLFAMHPARSRRLRGCGLVAYFLSVTQPIAGFVSSVSYRDGGSTPSAREAAQAGLLAPDNMPTMILCETRGL